MMDLTELNGDEKTLLSYAVENKGWVDVAPSRKEEFARMIEEGILVLEYTHFEPDDEFNEGMSTYKVADSIMTNIGTENAKETNSPTA